MNFIIIIKKLISKFFNSLGFEIIKHDNIKKTVYSRDLEFFKTTTGNYYLPKFAYSDIISNTIKRGEIFDKEIVNVASKFIKKGTVVLDVGSNFGQMAMLFSKMVGEDGKVYAFDADDFIFEILTKNILANSIHNIEPIFGAVHDTKDQLLYFPIQDFKKYETYGSYGIDYINNKGREVKTVTIDSLNIRHKISFMKIDIQGGDLFALKGAKNTILQHKMPIIFEYEYLFEEELNLNFQQYVDFVNEIGYKFEKVINGQNYLILPR